MSLDLTQVLPDQTWSDVLASININTKVKDLFESSSVIQITLLENIQYKRYKQPTKKEYINEKGFKVEEWTLDELIHREDRPAYIVKTLDGVKILEAWYLNNKTHRVNGPAAIERFTDGSLALEVWSLNDQRHRDPEQGPAITIWRKDGQLFQEHWYLNDQHHRDPEQGPAFIHYRDGQIQDQRWFVHDKAIKKPVK